MFEWFAFGLTYCFIGAVTGGIAAYCTRKQDQEDPLIVCAAIFWPFTWGAIFAWAVASGTHRALIRLGRSIGHRKHQANIVRQTVAMMEQDQERLGPQGAELALQWEYVPCPQCFGSGCRKCGDGVVRLKAGVPVNSNGRALPS